MEKLYNGITLPEAWPPMDLDDHSQAPLPVPYMENRPEIVDIDVGRQLFVDDFLIEESTLEKHFHSARFLPEDPVLRPETPLEMNAGLRPSASPFTDGCWYDPQDGLYRLYYHAGWMDGTALAISRDAVHWTRKMLDIQPGTNRIIMPPKGWRRDGSCVWLDTEATDQMQRYKLFEFFRTPEGELAQVWVSRDGMHFEQATRTGQCGDNSSFFYNPFRKKWVFSIRQGAPVLSRYIRARRYYECDDFLDGAAWRDEQTAFWLRCDEIDRWACQPGVRYSESLPPQLYHVNCVAYESVMLGLFGIIKGFDEYDNGICEHTGFPKHIDLHVAFSRDGFHFTRDNRAPFIACTDCDGDWNRGYLHACGGLCLVSRDRLLFPVGGFSGESPVYGHELYSGSCTGLAELRRDGFASMHANWSKQFVTTRPVRFSKGRCLFVNAQAQEGYVGCEILDEHGVVIPGFSFDNCVPVCADDTCQQIRFVNRDLSELCGRAIRFRFNVCKADLYAFWISPDEHGKSGGYVAAGGPDYPGNRDV